MCEHDQQFEEIRLEMQQIKIACAHQSPSAKTLAMFDTLNYEIQKMNGKLDKISPFVESSMEESKFYQQLWSKMKEGGGLIKWIITLIVAILVFSGYLKSAVIAWLATR